MPTCADTALAVLGGLHPRALLRHALVRRLRTHPAVSALLADRIHPNRFAHWHENELPAAGVYTVSETNLDSDVSPEPDERRVSLNVELLVQATERLDDLLDALALALESAMDIEAIGAVMTELAEERLGRSLPRDAQGRSPADCLLLVRHTGTEQGVATDGRQETGVCVLTFEFEYGWPDMPPNLDDLRLAATDWDVAPADGHIDMQSRVEFPPVPSES